MKLATKSICFVGFWQARFHMEVGQTANKDTLWGKRCILYNLKLLVTSEGTTRDLQMSCFTQPCYYWFDWRKQ